MIKRRSRWLISTLASLERWRQRRSVRLTFTVFIVALAPVLGLATWLAFDGLGSRTDNLLRTVLTLDLVYIIVVAGMVAMRVGAMVAARRARSAGSKLHARLTTVFAVIALGPTIIVAIFAAISINFGLEGWFSERVQRVIGNSFEAAQAYESEHRENLSADAELLANYINRNKDQFPLISAGEMRELLASGQAQMLRELTEAYIIDGSAELRARGLNSYLFDYEAPTAQDLQIARESGTPVILEDWENNEFRALVYLTSFADRYLYVTRNVDGKVLELLDETQATFLLYRQLEGERGQLLFEFALIYLGFAVIVILAAIWLAFWFADRLSRPVARLAGAAQQVGSGNFTVRVREEKGDDEIAMLGRAFNRMTTQVKNQRDALVEAGAESEQARRLFEAVLSGVTAGVIGLDPEGRVEVMNEATRTILGLGRRDVIGVPIADLVPEFAEPFERLEREGRDSVQAQLRLTTPRRAEELLVRVARHHIDAERDGFVITFDAITDLVSAQRMAAWGDVARRIAHEIKNPLTPIQLAAERMKRKYGRQLAEDQVEGFTQYTDVIVRQTNDLRRIVDEFSQFARMPEPRRKPLDLVKAVQEALLLRRDGSPDVAITDTLPNGVLMIEADETMIGQALGNLLKNGCEAISMRDDGNVPGLLDVSLSVEEGIAVLRITDNGCGLPDGPPERLFEPYVTHRDKGTGLGLPIVKKIIEDHAGTLNLAPAGADAPEPGQGAVAIVTLPLLETEAGKPAATRSETEHA
ncbi:sensor histidine kinase NtrY-like [Pontivivens insulae]|uniref:histidine kinase n=1 Tax=Pontivivens insulae TaxID=1639689 RepID=A0A2R8AAW4_9RHOB|nr:PAS domain-containing sensor histidine kinase [Pontivivens insulae]RED13282.1 two-component system nitrogen regulation sensor histidine kinase NtrY [Pontivivens insulae]SPF29374.1 Sensor protein kinase WalK [Pontivivens insulae]